jgi:hypothetical protein
MRVPAARTNPKPRAAQLKTFPAPVSGWIANQNLLTPNARKPDGSVVMGAAMLENWFPTATGIRMRGGSDLFATIGNEVDNVVSMFSYLNGNAANLFAATPSEIYDITSPEVPFDVDLVDQSGNNIVDQNGNLILGQSSILAPDVDLLASGDWSVVQFSTPGGTFLRCVNGVDTPLVFDGTNWSTSPAITGVDPTTLSYVFASKFRLWFVQKDTLNIYYLAPNAIGGAATLLPLGGIFTLGGALLFGGTWSIESGDGPSEQTVFVTTEGEVATYTGSDPSDATNWSRQGVFRIGKPLGPKAFIRAGGDMIISTTIGLIPLSTAFQRDVAALSPVAVSYSIEIEWNAAVAASPDPSWQVALWPTKQMMLVAPPNPDGAVPKLFAANARTGAWASFTGWNVFCMAVFNDRLFFGSDSGKIVEAEVTGSDQGSAYTCTCVPLFDPLKSPAALKTGLEARAVLRATSQPTPKMSLQADYTVNLPAAPDDTTIAAANTWGTGIWGQAQWGTAAASITVQAWESTPGAGYSLSPATQITSGNLSAPDVELVSTDLTYDVGDVGT